MDPIKAAQALLDDLKGMKIRADRSSMFYNPLEYAWQSYRDYLKRYGMQRKESGFLLGMNPGALGNGTKPGCRFGEVFYRPRLAEKSNRIRVNPSRSATSDPCKAMNVRAAKSSGAQAVGGGPRDRFWKHPSGFF